MRRTALQRWTTPEGIDGRSFAGVLSGKTKTHRDWIFCAYQGVQRALRDERYKYVHFTNLPPLFFDLDKDPNEFTNIATDRAYAPQVLEYAQKLLSWRMNHDEQTLTHIMLSEEGPITRRAPRY